MDQLGKTIKKKKEDLGLLVKELPSHMGMTPSLISQFERGKAFSSIVTLKKISNVLQTTVGELIGEHDKLSQHAFLKSNDRKFVKKNKKGTSLHMLSDHDPSKRVEPYVIPFNKNSNFKGIMTSNSGKEAEILWIITPNNNKINTN